MSKLYTLAEFIKKFFTADSHMSIKMNKGLKFSLIEYEHSQGNFNVEIEAENDSLFLSHESFGSITVKSQSPLKVSFYDEDEERYLTSPLMQVKNKEIDLDQFGLFTEEPHSLYIGLFFEYNGVEGRVEYDGLKDFDAFLEAFQKMIKSSKFYKETFPPIRKNKIRKSKTYR